MKNCIILIVILALFASCEALDSKVGAARTYVEDNINLRDRFDVTILDFKKVDGQSFVNKYTGEDMYALEFHATVRSNREGFVLINEDGTVQTFRFHDYDGTDEVKRLGIPFREVRHINTSDTFTVHNKVIMAKKESGWNPIALRWDLY